MAKKTVRRLVTRREAAGDHSLYMGYNHGTDCKTCDGTGYVIEVRPGVFLPVFGDEDHLQAHGVPMRCCPDCNPDEVLPRDACVECSRRGRSFVRGHLYTGNRMSWREGRLVVFHGYLCDQCAQTIEEDGGTLR